MTTSETPGPGEGPRSAGDPVRRTSFSTHDADRGITAMTALHPGLGMRAPTDGSFGLRPTCSTPVSPKMTRYRLAQVRPFRRDLLGADPGAGGTVAAVAVRWGFGHPGRFATAYRARCGEPPGTTLHR